MHHASPVSSRTKSRQRATSAPAGRPLAEILALPALEGAQLVPADVGDQVRVCAVVLDDPGARSEDAALLVSVTGIPKTLPS